MQLQAHFFKETLYMQSTLGGGMKYVTIFFGFDPRFMPQRGMDLGLRGFKREIKFNSKFDTGSFLVEPFAIFKFCFRWEA